MAETIFETNVTSKSRTWTRVIWPLALMGTILWASGTQGPDVPSAVRFNHFDKAGHFLVFGLIGTLFYRVVREKPGGAKRILMAIAVTSLFGVMDEFRQSFNPNRSVEFADWIADTSGATLAILIYHFWGIYRKLLETRLIPFRRRRNEGVATGGAEDREIAAGNRPA